MRNGNHEALRTSDPAKKGGNSTGSFIILANASLENNPTTKEKHLAAISCPS